MPKATAARARAAGLDREAHVLAFPHRPRVAERRVRDAAATTPGLPRPNGASALQLLGELHARARSPPTTASTRSSGADVLGREHRARRARRTPAANSSTRAALDLQAGGGAVAAVAHAGARRRRAGPPSRSNASMLRPEPLPVLAVQRDQHDRAVVALGQPRGDDPDHARRASPRPRARRPARSAELPRSALRPRSGCASRPAGARGWRGRAPRRSAPRAAGPRSGSARARRRRGTGARRRSAAAPARRRPRARRRLPGSTRATAISARSPGLAVPASARSPRRTSVRFSPDSGTTSAIVASATRSRSSSRRARSRRASRRRAPTRPRSSAWASL